MKTAIPICILAICGLLVTTPVLAKKPAIVPVATPAHGPQDAIRSADDEGIITLKSGSYAALEGVFYPQPLRAKAWLADHAGQPFTYRALGNDRYGRLRLIPTLGVQTLEQTMLHDGAALVFDRDNVPGLSAWMKDEDAARQKKLGIWNDPDLVLTDERTSNFVGQFHLVEGVVRHIYEGRDATYLNFGDDWKNDFSVHVPKGARRGFGGALGELEGKKVRVRGMIYEENGPMVTINRPEQLEVLSHDKK